MRTVDLKEAVAYALAHMPGELASVYVSASSACISLRPPIGPSYTLNVSAGPLDDVNAAIRQRRADLARTER